MDEYVTVQVEMGSGGGGASSPQTIRVSLPAQVHTHSAFHDLTSVAGAWVFGWSRIGFFVRLQLLLVLNCKIWYFYGNLRKS